MGGQVEVAGEQLRAIVERIEHVEEEIRELNEAKKWARRTKSLDALLPILYLRGISTGDFQEALTALLGKDAPRTCRRPRWRG
jgi:hypothetical protein